MRAAPAFTVAAFALPIGAGLAGTLLPAFGILPALGRSDIGLAAWQMLAAQPGAARSIALTLTTGLAATLLSVLLALALAAVLQGAHWARRIGAAIAPLMAMPHAALAIGVAFLIAPSGWLARAVSPHWSGWDVPPDLLTIGHPSGWPIVLSLLLKEVPYLLLMTLGALHQVPAAARVAQARTLGYGAPQAWLAAVLPAVYPQIRLPVYAALAYSLSTVDVAMILGPGAPPTLAVLAVRWFTDPDPLLALPGSAAAVLILLLVLATVLLWRLTEAIIARAGRRWITAGRRSRSRLLQFAPAAGGMLLAFAAAALIGLALWSVAAQWRFPDALPGQFTLDHWQRQASALRGPALTTVLVGIAATAIALVLAIACLENEARFGGTGTDRPASLRLLYLPLLVPQVAFLFGAQVLLVRAGLDGSFAAVVWAHLVYVLPYVFLSLAEPWRAFDARYTRSALALGRSRMAAFFRIKLPMLAAPVLIAAAVGFAISAGQYLPTLFAGAGRVATLTTEAVTLATGADRRVIGVWAMLQAALPLAAYATALALPALLLAMRRARDR